MVRARYSKTMEEAGVKFMVCTGYRLQCQTIDFTNHDFPMHFNTLCNGASGH